MSEKTLGLIKEHEARWVDLRFTDSRGKEQHVTTARQKLMKISSNMAQCLMVPPSPVGSQLIMQA